MTTEDIQGWLQQVAAANPQNTKLLRLAQTSEGRFVWALEIRPQGTPQENFQRLAVVCRQHGDEPEMMAAGAEFIYQLLTSPTARTSYVLSRTAILVIPVANPDGASRKQRHNALGQDLNRATGAKAARAKFRPSCISFLVGDQTSLWTCISGCRATLLKRRWPKHPAGV